MENFYGISNSKVHKRMSLNFYSHQLGQMDMVDQCLLHDVHATGLQNLNSPNLRYFQSGRSLLASPSSGLGLDNRSSVGYMYRHSSGNRSVESRMEAPRQSRSALPFSITPLKLEEDVVVFDGVVVNNNVPVEKARSSSLSLTDSGSSSSSSGKSYKTDVCMSYLQTSGFCRYGSKCQFAHGNKELNPVPFAYKNMLETPCKSYSLSGTSAFGSKCRFLHQETSTPPSATIRTVSLVKPDKPTGSIVSLESTNWSPVDDDIETHLKEGIDAYINMVLYGMRRIKRLQVFSQICSERCKKWIPGSLNQCMPARPADTKTRIRARLRGLMALDDCN